MRVHHYISITLLSFVFISLQAMETTEPGSGPEEFPRKSIETESAINLNQIQSPPGSEDEPQYSAIREKVIALIAEFQSNNNIHIDVPDYCHRKIDECFATTRSKIEANKLIVSPDREEFIAPVIIPIIDNKKRAYKHGFFIKGRFNLETKIIDEIKRINPLCIVFKKIKADQKNKQLVVTYYASSCDMTKKRDQTAIITFDKCNI